MCQGIEERRARGMGSGAFDAGAQENFCIFKPKRVAHLLLPRVLGKTTYRTLNLATLSKHLEKPKVQGPSRREKSTDRCRAKFKSFYQKYPEK